ncbi:YiiX/YebB-like N1pC/P60 family cysteine hydrolase [Brevibacillus laterosporus]|uniref:YiiX/YebB-like N1pC/P60 family cysteine hydrolase n=1 Tax=Brevibacillus laterosporus TaxID=1465 RepID=UPI00144440B2|nr:YiiX/YebB-like N1pC/P60 family cysteine hydrolase [Brevibacillus laterosporus]NKQ22656.1 hypothetical protein [Brevibacillus laterosporus]WNX30388.1 YiiX/YebB-like N1pC/P60 family cysteine hydrolase [Brevibacillus laterosporus]
MKRRGFVSLFAILTAFALTTNAFAMDTQEELVLTKEQEQEVKEAKERTKNFTQSLKGNKIVKNQLQDFKIDSLKKKNLSGDSATMAVDDEYPTRSGVILVTTDFSSDTSSGWVGGHAGIIYSKSTTVEAYGLPGKYGVLKLKNDWNKRGLDNFVAVTLKRTSTKDDDKASNWAYDQIDKGYNYNFWDIETRKRFYCSQLVYAAYKDTVGIDLNDDGGAVWPVDLADSRHVSSIYEEY